MTQSAADGAAEGAVAQESVNPLMVELIVPEGSVVGTVLQVPNPTPGGPPWKVTVPKGAEVGTKLRFAGNGEVGQVVSDV